MISNPKDYYFKQKSDLTIFQFFNRVFSIINKKEKVNFKSE